MDDARRAQLADASAIRLLGITKRFGRVIANRDINLDIARAPTRASSARTVLATYTMSILYGFYQADGASTLTISASSFAIARTPSRTALVWSISTMLVDPFTVVENVILGAEGSARLAPGIADARAELARLVDEYSLDVDPDAVCGELTVGAQQRVEPEGAVSRCRILVLDDQRIDTAGG